MKSKLLVTCAALFSTTAFAFCPPGVTPYDCISNSDYSVLFSGHARNQEIPGLIAQCESQGGTLLYFALNN